MFEVVVGRSFSVIGVVVVGSSSAIGVVVVGSVSISSVSYLYSYSSGIRNSSRLPHLGSPGTSRTPQICTRTEDQTCKESGISCIFPVSQKKPIPRNVTLS